MKKLKVAVLVVSGLATATSLATAYWLAKTDGLLHYGPHDQEL